VEEFVSPPPRRIHEDYFKRIQGGHKAGEKLFDLRELKPEQISTLNRGQYNIGPGGIGWTNHAGNIDYLHFLGPLDTSTRDFTFEMEAGVETGQAPLIILGEPKSDIRDPDYNGYLAGASTGGLGHVIKKQGFFVARSDAVQPARKTHAVLRKTGRALVLSVNGKEAVRYYDPAFIHNRRAFFCLGLRSGGKAHVRSVCCLTGPTIDTEKPFTVSETIVKLKCGSPKYFSMAAFQNLALNVHRNRISGYVLNDVTQLREKVDAYRRQYEEEKKKGNELELLLDEFRAEKFGQEGQIFIGTGRTIGRIKDKAALIAPTNASVLIQGPTGTGKEVLARFIHDKSPRKDKPFIKVDCSTLPRELVESELFGHEKGSFTGAVDRKIGRFEQANGGTIFLDEISNISRDTQSKLLNVLQDLTITRIGGNKAIPLDVRVLTASNLNLEQLVANGAFREDLYYRINAITITLPPLSGRREDIPDLCRYFISFFNHAVGRRVKGLSAQAHRKIHAYAWPGNIRELRNVIQNAVIFCEGDLIETDHVQIAGGEPGAAPERAQAAKPSYHLRDLDREKLLEVVREHRGVVSAIARALGISRQACYDNFAKYGIKVGEYRGRR
jgi:transcriptional regulator with PAS, ATPase and Fis domain